MRNTKLIGGPLFLLARTTTSMEDGGAAIAHRLVILECFGCVGLVLTTIVHRFVWSAYALLLLQRKKGGRNIGWCGGFFGVKRQSLFRRSGLSRRTGTASICMRPSRLNVNVGTFDCVTSDGVQRNTAQVDSVA